VGEKTGFLSDGDGEALEDKMKETDLAREQHLYNVMDTFLLAPSLVWSSLAQAFRMMSAQTLSDVGSKHGIPDLEHRGWEC